MDGARYYQIKYILHIKIVDLVVTWVLRMEYVYFLTALVHWINCGKTKTVIDLRSLMSVLHSRSLMGLSM